MICDQPPSSGRPFWTTLIDSPFVRALCPDIHAAHAAGTIGTDEAQRRLLSFLRERVSGVLRRYPGVDPDDVLHELLVRMAARGLAAGFDPARGVNARAYLYGVVRNIARELRRRRGASARGRPDAAPLLEAKPSEGAGPLDAASYKDLLTAVRDRYLGLSRAQQDALLVIYPFLEPGRTPERHRNEYVNRWRALRSLRDALPDKE